MSGARGTDGETLGPIRYREMTGGDYEEAMALWSQSFGVMVRSADSPESFRRYLSRNPGLSLVATAGGRVVGTALVGHDGRRGFIHHLVVAPDHRRRGIGRALAERACDKLRSAGIGKCHIHVFTENAAAQGFWRAAGWRDRPDTLIMSRLLTDDANA